MTGIIISLTVPSASGVDAAAVGSLDWQPTARRNFAGTVKLPAPFPVVLAGAPVTVPVDPTGPTWCWRVLERVTGGAPTWRYLAVPDSPTAIAYSDLVEVDPATLAPIGPAAAAAWAAALAGKLDVTALATTTALGTVQLAGDLGGTAAAPTVPGLALKLDAAAYTAADVLAKVKTVDGIGSGLDADTLAGVSAAGFATAAQGTKADTAVTRFIITGAGIDLTGVSDSTAAIQAIITAHPGAALYLPAGVYRITTLTLSRGQHLLGAGQQAWRDTTDVFGSAGWMVNGNFTGTILRSTATSGVALTILDTVVNQGGCSDLTIIGPGSGTSIGISMGSATMSVVNPLVKSVRVGNFATGLYTRNVNDGSFYDLHVRGCQLALDLGASTNQNAFYTLDVERCGDGLHLASSTYANAFYSPLFQSNTGTAVTVSGVQNAFFNPYFESNTAGCVIGSGSVGASIHSPFSNDVADGYTIAAGVLGTSIVGFRQSAAVPVVNAGTDTYLQGRFAALTDTGTNTIIVDPSLGVFGAAWTAYAPALTGTGWAIGDGTIVGYSMKIGKTEHFRGLITFGAASTFGSVTPVVSLPSTVTNLRGAVNVIATRSGVGMYSLLGRMDRTVGFSVWGVSTAGALTTVTATSPAAWGSGDTWEFSGTRERA
ncbi:MAG: glycosyl hydrolase family 28-related protein [Rhodoglobus sp.]